MIPRPSPAGTASAPLLYWLLVVCGLAGLTVLRFDTPNDLVPMWLGTVVGVALGQLVAWLRVRAWLLAVVTMGAFWLGPMFFFVVYQSSGGAAETCVFAFLPAAVCGYLSLSERGALVAFWYPAVLWMLVILDGPVPGAFDGRTALPLMIGLAALFVAFLRARETRRVAIWRGHGSARLATPMPRTVLRTSPLRTASQLAWTGLSGAAALVLAAWIAPHLWQKEQAKHANAAAAQAAAQSAESGAAGEEPCCPELEEEKRLRVREYFPLFHGRDGERHPKTAACAVCRDGKPVTAASGGDGEIAGGASGGISGGSSGGIAGGSSGGISGGTSGGISGGSSGGISGGSSGGISGGSSGGHPPTTSVSDATSTTAALAPSPTPAVSPSPTPRPTSDVPRRTGATPSSPKRTTVGIVLQPAAPPPNPGAPWKPVLAFCLGGLALHVLVRALRRQLTLRHLTRPFWAETLDQRISNHWQRMLIGLGDAGIHPALDEQPQALARRVGIDGIGTCATILERVRHGVRVDAADLEAMDSAAGAVYRAAREKAGISGRAAALLRWPLA